jgi:hypothetical protein
MHLSIADGMWAGEEMVAAVGRLSITGVVKSVRGLSNRVIGFSVWCTIMVGVVLLCMGWYQTSNDSVQLAVKGLSQQVRPPPPPPPPPHSLLVCLTFLSALLSHLSLLCRISLLSPAPAP